MIDATTISAKDPKGYYACLGLEPAATADEIKAAYRQIAKELHPDRNPDADAKARFQAINEAYEILGNAAHRATYDTLRYAREKLAADPAVKLDPICCSICGRVTALPRSLIFTRVYSLVFRSVRRPVQGVFCAACARKIALQESFISAVAGWWALPRGPIYTIAEICRNAGGGVEQPGAAQQLAWYNALAFYSQGELSLAYALALRLRSATDPEIALNAAKLASHARSLGARRRSSSLKDPWRFNPLDLCAHGALMSVMPLALIALLFHADIGGWIRHHSAPPAAAVATTATSPPGAPAICAAPPHNGDVLGGYLNASSPGHLLTIIDGSGKNAIVKVRDAAAGRVAVSFFIGNHSVASYAMLPDGTYRIQYALGDALGQDCHTFTAIAAAGEFQAVETLRGASVPLTYSIDTNTGSGAQAQPIGAAIFNAD